MRGGALAAHWTASCVREQNTEPAGEFRLTHTRGEATIEPTTEGGAAAAEPGTYGIPPKGWRLPDATHVGRVRLQVSDLARSLDYYERVLGFESRDRQAGRALLAPPGADRELIELRERRGAAPAPPHGRLGLYHFAILLPDRASLGRFISHLAERDERAGAADHLVSEALYLTDPDGLGIEVYADRPRSAWTRLGRQLAMDTQPLDVPSLVREAAGEPWTGMPGGTRIGHVHLHVGDLDVARRFYHDGLGFDLVVWSYPRALFLSAGGYHHHLGINTWAGVRATPPAESDAQLLEWELVVPTARDVEAALRAIADAGFEGARAADDGIVRDPSGTPMRIRT